MITINISPVAFTIGNLEVRWYGIMIALAIMVLILWTLWQVKKGAKVTYDTVFTAALIGIPSGVIFSRLLHIIDDWEYYRQHLNQVVGAEGLTIYGAVLGAALAIWIYSRFSKVHFGYFADLLTPGIILAQAIGRVGCTLNGCCYGIEAGLPWCFVYTDPQSFAPIGVAVHPTQVYEIIFLLLLFSTLFLLRDRFKPDGSLFLVYLSLYSLWRLGIDYLREGTPFFLGLHQAQVIALVVLAVAIPLLAYRTRRVKKDTPTQ